MDVISGIGTLEAVVALVATLFRPQIQHFHNLLQFASGHAHTASSLHQSHMICSHISI